jgi:hypothetical protein
MASVLASLAPQQPGVHLVVQILSLVFVCLVFVLLFVYEFSHGVQNGYFPHTDRAGGQHSSTVNALVKHFGKLVLGSLKLTSQCFHSHLYSLCFRAEATPRLVFERDRTEGVAQLLVLERDFLLLAYEDRLLVLTEQVGSSGFA